MYWWLVAPHSLLTSLTLTLHVLCAQISNFPLTATTTKALLSRGISKLFPIQGATFRPLSEGRDLIGRARTGTGKTLAFSLPIIDKLVKVRLRASQTATGSRRLLCGSRFIRAVV